MTNHPVQSAATQGLELSDRVEANAVIIWPGEGRSFELDFETDDYEYWYCVLLELCGDVYSHQWFEPRTMTGPYRSKDRAARALDEELEHCAIHILANKRSAEIGSVERDA
jgi:hypothetical protein